MEGRGTATIIVCRSGDLSVPALVDWTTRDGTAKAGQDYVAGDGQLAFSPNEASKKIEVLIIDDNEYEPDEFFEVTLSNPRLSSGDGDEKAGGGGRVVLGARQTSQVTIIDDDFPGTLIFELSALTTSESAGSVDVVVSRIEGCSGEIGCSYRTIDGDAMAGPDYTSTSGTLTFAAGQAKKVVSIPIINSEVYEKDEVFKLELFSPTGGTGFGEGPTGAALATVACEIKITSDESAKETVDTIASLVKLPINQHAFDHAAATWSEQFRDALDVNGGETVEVPAGAVPWTLHVLSLPWKLLFACVPPVHIASGKLAFFVALSFIGGVTAVIGDIAGLFGCLLGLPDAITAITFVAMGTSLPDTFASRAAAMNDANADASIVNVTGSNAVNVFLGLGLPWLIGAVYWWLKGPSSAWAARYPEQAARYPDGGFVVLAGDLVASVSAFLGCALVCFAGLTARRAIFGYELGGEPYGKWGLGALFTLLWAVYLTLSCKSTYEAMAQSQ